MKKNTFLLVYDQRTIDIKNLITDHCKTHQVLAIENTRWGKIYHPEVHIKDGRITTNLKSDTACIQFNADDLFWLLTDIPYLYETTEDSYDDYFMYQQEELSALVISFLYNVPAEKINALELNDPFRYLNGIHRIAALNSLLKTPFTTLAYNTEDSDIRIGWEHLQFSTNASTFFVDKHTLKKRELGLLIFFNDEALQYKITSKENILVRVDSDTLDKVVSISTILKKKFIEILFFLDDNTILQISDVPFQTVGKLKTEDPLQSLFANKINSIL